MFFYLSWLKIVEKSNNTDNKILNVFIIYYFLTVLTVLFINNSLIGNYLFKG